jgi:hypothetical protein
MKARLPPRSKAGQCFESFGSITKLLILLLLPCYACIMGGRMSYDIEQETVDSRKMLEARIPAKLNDIYRLLVENRQGLEPWRLALTIDLVQSVERNCGELVERLHKKSCDVMGVENETSVITAQRIKDTASEKLGLEDIDSKFLAVADASKAKSVDMGGGFTPCHRFLSKFAHPTAALVHGITHQPEICRNLQAICTTQGVYFAAQSTLAIEAQLGIPLATE